MTSTTRFTLSPAEQEGLLARFVRYVKVDTQSDDEAPCFPTTEKQKDLARILVEELKELGCADAEMDEWGYVMATVPERLPEGHGPVPVIGLIAHMDTYPGTSGKDVKPQVLRNYQGAPIVLPGTGEILPKDGNPNLAKCLGHTLVHTDGTTLLGGDDKAGIAIILSLVAFLKDHPEVPHGRLRIGFTPDEEVGRGTEHFDVAKFAADYAYTIDGAELGEVEDETFSADGATVTVTGHDVHPGYAKDKMVNAVRAASAVIEALGDAGLPERTEGREAYLHPMDLKGDVTQATLKLLVRAFSEEELTEQAQRLHAAVAAAQARFPKAHFQVEIRQQYRNMRYAIEKDPRVVDHAITACQRQGIEPLRRAIRGGTDGSRLSFMGLLTPNLWDGAQSYHSVHEWVSLDWMAASVETGLQLLQVWREQ